MVVRKRQSRNFLTAALTLVLLVNAGSQAADSPAQPMPNSVHPAIDPIVADLIKLAGDGRIDQMLDRIGPLPDDERDDSGRTRDRLVNFYANAGKYSGFDIAGIKQLAPRFQVAYVMVYFEKRPVMFEFGFYQINGKWRPQTFRLETDFKGLLDTMPLQK